MHHQLNLAPPGWLPCRCGCGEYAPPLERIRPARGTSRDGSRFLPGHQGLIDQNRTEKVCSDCKEVKPVGAFHRNRAMYDGYHNICRECRKKQRYASDGVARHRKRLYGLTEEQFIGMVQEQEGRCAICGDVPARLCVDHDHASGQIRALLCGECNLGLGKFKDEPERLRAAAEYILRFVV